MLTGEIVKKELGLQKFPNVMICRVLVSTFRVYLVIYDSKMKTRPITDAEIKRMQYVLPGMMYPFARKPVLLPSIKIETFNGSLVQSMFFVIDISGKYSDRRDLEKVFENTPQYYGPLKEFVTMSDLADNSATSSFTKSTRAQRNRAVGAENKTAKLVDVNIDTVEDHVTFIFKTTATLPIYPDDATYGKTNPDTFEIQRNPDKEYEMYIRILNFFEWLKGTKPEAESITQEDIKDVLKVNNVQVFSTSPSYHWQGMNYWLSQLDGSIYPTDIEPKLWNASNRHGNDGTFLDKHLAGLMKQMAFFRNPMALMLTKRLKDRGLI